MIDAPAVGGASGGATELRYAVYGFLLRAGFPLHGLPACAERDAPLGEVAVRLGDAPHHLDAASLVRPAVEISPEAVLLKPRLGGFNLGRILIHGGREIVVTAEAAAPFAELQPFILGSGMGAVCFQNGLLPLHASAVSSGSEAIAFAGVSGAGKSTMAAALVAQGLAALTDDVSVLELGATVTVYPGPPVMRLTAEASRALGIQPPSGDFAPARRDKLQFSNAAPAAANASKTLAAIYLLELGDAPIVTIEPLTGAHAVAALAGEIYRHAWLAPMNLLEARIRDVALLARRVPCFRLRRPHRFDFLPNVVDAVLRHRAEAGG